MSKRGLLLVNLGTPDSHEVPYVRKYLREFLMDPRVIDIAYPLRFLLVNGIIAPFRAGQSAEAYRSIWKEGGSPLYLHSKGLLDRVRRRVTFPVELAMRYGSPSIHESLVSLRKAGVDAVTILPLFPHYAMSSYESAMVAAKGQAERLQMEAIVVPPFYKNEGYISALAKVSAPYLDGADHVLFSFHGVPERHLIRSDPTGNICLQSAGCCHEPNAAHNTCYRHQCFQTVKHVAKALELVEGGYSVAFQSRLGRDEWLKPATDKHLEALAHKGIRRVAVICASFTSDCLETLEEIGIGGRETYLAAGGEQLTLVPCLNDNAAWADEVVRMAIQAGEQSTGHRGTETVSTALRFAASPEAVWQRMMTYEEVPSRPSFLLRALLPVPLGTKGDKTGVGAEIHCRYEKGHLVKRTTVVEAPRLLRFEVTEQHLGVENRVRAVEGSYELKPSGKETEIVLTTKYRAHLRPRFLWRPIERFMGHQFHRHILEGMRTAVAQPSTPDGVGLQGPACSTSDSLSRR